MSTPRWLTRALVETLHAESLARFGGLAGIRDADLLESALARPQHLFSYHSAATVFELAAAYCSGIVRNHPFLDGNKRAGLLAARTFLFLNGYHFNPDEAETVHMIEGLAAGSVDEAQLTDWLTAYASPR